MLTTHKAPSPFGVRWTSEFCTFCNLGILLLSCCRRKMISSCGNNYFGHWVNKLCFRLQGSFNEQVPSLTLKRTFSPSTIFSFGSALGDSRPTNLENDNTSQTEELILLHENQAINEKKNWSLKQFLFLANWFEWLVPTRATSQLNLLENPVLFDKSNLSLPVQRG